MIVDDEPEVREVVAEVLALHGFNVLEAGSGSQARALLRDARPDVVLLDLGLPDESGLDLLRAFTDDEHIAVIVLSGRSGEYDRIVGLDLGADDYVAKPFSSRELVSRVSAVLRRAARHEDAVVMRFGDLLIDERSREVEVCGRPVALTAREFDVLAFLAHSPRQVFSRAQLLQRVWASSPNWQDDKTVREHVHRIRRKLDEDDRERWIQTVRGVGYRFAVT